MSESTSEKLDRVAVFVTASALAKRAKQHRESVRRLILGGLLSPDAFLVRGDGTERRPLFKLDETIPVVRHPAAPPARMS